MIGKLVIETSKPEFVNSVKKGTLLRFSVTFGFSETNGKTWACQMDGCLGFIRDGEFTWGPPQHKLTYRYQPFITITPDLFDAVVRCLHEQRVIEAYRKKLDEEVQHTKKEFEPIENIQPVGRYVE